jgi:hypothetical protein
MKNSSAEDLLVEKTSFAQSTSSTMVSWPTPSGDFPVPLNVPTLVPWQNSDHRRSHFVVLTLEQNMFGGEAEHPWNILRRVLNDWFRGVTLSNLQKGMAKGFGHCSSLVWATSNHHFSGFIPEADKLQRFKEIVLKVIVAKSHCQWQVCNAVPCNPLVMLTSWTKAPCESRSDAESTDSGQHWAYWA